MLSMRSSIGEAVRTGSTALELPPVAAAARLWAFFAVSSAAIAALTAWVVVARTPWLAILILTGYVLGIAYTVPPIATAYRPFTGEWLGGFPGVLLSGLGAYAIQARLLPLLPIRALSAHA